MLFKGRPRHLRQSAPGKAVNSAPGQREAMESYLSDQDNGVRHSRWEKAGGWPQ